MNGDYRETALPRLRLRHYGLLLLAPLLLWPAIVNGGAFFFPDTSFYVRTIDALAVRTIGRPSEWTSERTLHVAAPDAQQTIAATSPTPTAAVERPVLSGRSPFYGAITYLGVLFGSFWVVIVLQALAATATVVGAMRHAASPDQEGAFTCAVLAAMAVLTVTPLPFYVGMLMPDVFAGLAIVAAATLLVGWRRETRWGRAGWVALAALGALTHSVTMLILLAIVGAAALLWLLRRQAAPQGVAIMIVIAAALVGLTGETVFSKAVAHMTGHAPIRPPFITARLTADGPGTDYLKTHCSTERWTLCRFRDRLPLYSDGFLWDENPATGVFMTIAPDDMRALSGEQIPFALAVLRDRPVAVLRSSAAAIVGQASRVGLEEFHYTPEEYADFVTKMPAGLTTAMRATAAYRHTMPLAPIVALAWPLLLGSVLTIALAWRRPALRQLAAFGTWIAFGWCVNIAICGGLSTPHERYNMRVLWMLPLAATMIGAAAVNSGRRRRLATEHSPAQA